MSKLKDIKGQRFGRLKVYKIDRTKKRIHWFCKCDCGKEISVSSGHIISGHTQSCGCIRIENLIKTLTKHGMAESDEYKIWRGIKNRCFFKRNIYKNYNGRNIKICNSWLKFENFYKDMGKRPSKNHSIDRIDNDGNYCKENCRWATAKEQNRNTRNNKMITYNGKTLCMAEWAEKLNINYKSLWYRLNYGWSIERAFTTKSR